MAEEPDGVSQVDSSQVTSDRGVHKPTTASGDPTPVARHVPPDVVPEPMKPTSQGSDKAGCALAMFFAVVGAVFAVKGWLSGRASARANTVSECFHGSMGNSFLGCDSVGTSGIKLFWWGILFAILYSIVAMIVAAIAVALLRAIFTSQGRLETKKASDLRRERDRLRWEARHEEKQAARLRRSTPLSEAGQRLPGGGLACPNCGGTSWKAGRAPGRVGISIATGVILMPIAGAAVAAVSTKKVVRCITCGATFKRS